MDVRLRIILIIVSVCYLLFLFNMLRRNRIDLRYTLVWILTSACMLLFAMLPGTIVKLSYFVGIEAPVNLVFASMLMFMLLILFSLTVVISHLSTRIRRLAQEMAILEKKLEERTTPIEECTKTETID